MIVNAIVQARMSSQRFPGKVLHNVAGKPMLKYLLERLKQCDSLDDIIVATSCEESDNPVEIFCKECNVQYFRGPLYDVAGRFKKVLELYPSDAFVRVNGDSPLLDHRLIDKCAGIFAGLDFDMVTNALVRSFPPGQSVEIVRSDLFMDVYGKMHEEEDMEHVTRYFYKNRHDFKIYNFESGIDCRGVSMVVDTPDDMNKFTRIIEKMDIPHWNYTFENILDLINKHKI